jgi:hypothetical protein
VMPSRTVALLAVLALAPAAALAAAGGAQKKAAPAKPAAAAVVVSARAQGCVECHQTSTPGLVKQWHDSTHARGGVGCLECHQRQQGAADAFQHGDALIATIVTPRDCGHCHKAEMEEFERSHHAKAGNILASLDNYIAETVEGARIPFNPHGTEPGSAPLMVNGMASAQSGCQQCHGTKVALKAKDGGNAVTSTTSSRGRTGSPPTRLRSPASPVTATASPRSSRRPGPTPASVGSTSTARSAPARPATAATTSRRGVLASPRTAGSATSARTTRRRRSSRSRSTGSRTATSATR